MNDDIEGELQTEIVCMLEFRQMQEVEEVVPKIEAIARAAYDQVSAKYSARIFNIQIETNSNRAATFYKVTSEVENLTVKEVVKAADMATRLISEELDQRGMKLVIGHAQVVIPTPYEFESA